MSINSAEAQTLEGRTVRASDGDKLGKVEDIHVDETGRAQYLEVRSGWFGTKHHVIPATGLTEDGDDLIVPFTKEQLEAAPTYDRGEEIDYDRERTLGGHYGHSVRAWEPGRDDWLAGEDLSRGPTPETRHPHGGRDDVRDTTEGPTPEIRRADRWEEGRDAAAAGQPETDRRTRGEGGGTQDRRDDDAVERDRIRDREMATDRGIATDREMAMERERVIDDPGMASGAGGRQVRLRRWTESHTRTR